MIGFAVEMDGAIGRAILGLPGAGYSWAEIAARLGVSRQAAQQRWGAACSGRYDNSPEHCAIKRAPGH
jgi:hypothetical protein